MKRIFLTLSVAFAVLAVSAQGTTTKTDSKAPAKTEAKDAKGGKTEAKTSKDTKSTKTTTTKTTDTKTTKTEPKKDAK